MILNNYWGGLVDLTVSGNKKLNLPRWSGDSASRNRNINKSDFKNGDILIYQINNKYYSRNYSEKTTYTKEDGLYAYIYINGSFVGVNGSGDTKRNSFTFSYYTNIYKTTDYKEKYSNINDFYNAKFYSNYNGIKDNQSMLEYINYLTLFDKDRFVILRPELIVAELIGVKISKDPKYNYIQGESIDKSVGSLLLSYSNGTTSEKKLSDSSVLVKTFDTSTVGKSKVVLSCGGFSVTYTINVTAKKEPEPIVPKEPKPTQPKEEEPIVTPTTPKEEETPETPVVETPTIPEEQSVTEPPIKQEEPTSKPPVSDEDSINEYQGENSQSIIEEPIEEQSDVEVSLPQPSIWFDIILGGIGFIFFILIIIYTIKGKKSYY